MKRCPHCGSDLTSGMTPDRSGPSIDGPATAARMVTCPDCEGPIDGFALGQTAPGPFPPPGNGRAGT